MVIVINGSYIMIMFLLFLLTHPSSQQLSQSGTVMGRSQNSD